MVPERGYDQYTRESNKSSNYTKFKEAVNVEYLKAMKNLSRIFNHVKLRSH